MCIGELRSKAERLARAKKDEEDEELSKPTTMFDVSSLAQLAN